MMVTFRPALHDAVARMHGYGRPWAIAGGWAIDLFVGRQTRRHSDIDIATLRSDQAALRAHLGDASVAKVQSGVLSEWRFGETLVLPVHEVHATWPDGTSIEFLLNEGDAERWVFRRDARVWLAFDRAFLRRDGVPYLAPEIALLYKSKDPSVTNRGDLLASVEHMDTDQQRWLRDAILLLNSSHPWLEYLTPD